MRGAGSSSNVRRQQEASWGGGARLRRRSPAWPRGRGADVGSERDEWGRRWPAQGLSLRAQQPRLPQEGGALGAGWGTCPPCVASPRAGGQRGPCTEMPCRPTPRPRPRPALLGTPPRLCPRVRPGPCGRGCLLLPIAPRPVSQADGGWDADVAGAAVGSGRSAQLALHRPRPWAPGEAKGRRPPRMSLSYSPCHAQSLRMHVTSRSSARCAGRRSRPPVAGWRAGVPARPLHAQ